MLAHKFVMWKWLKDKNNSDKSFDRKAKLIKFDSNFLNVPKLLHLNSRKIEIHYFLEGNAILILNRDTAVIRVN